MKRTFIAMAGNIGAGKTTAAKMISREFGHELFEEPVIDNRFLASYYDDMPRWSFTLQLEFLIKRVQHHQLISTIEKSCIQDRSLYEDPEIFAKYLHGLGHLEARELDLYYEYFQRLNENVKQPDKIICLTVPSADRLLDRIRLRGRVEEQSIDSGFLKGLNGFYQAFPEICRNKYGIDTLELDVTNLDIRSGEGRKEFFDRVGVFLGLV